MGSGGDCEVWRGGEVNVGLRLLGALKTFVDCGSTLGAGESLEGSDLEAGEGSRFCFRDVLVGGAPSKVISGCRLGLTLGSRVTEGNSVSREDGRDFVGVAAVKEA